jgi:hypothetical protein
MQGGALGFALDIPAGYRKSGVRSQKINENKILGSTGITD